METRRYQYSAAEIVTLHSEQVLLVTDVHEFILALVLLIDLGNELFGLLVLQAVTLLPQLQWLENRNNDSMVCSSRKLAFGHHLEHSTEWSTAISISTVEEFLRHRH